MPGVEIVLKTFIIINKELCIKTLIWNKTCNGCVLVLSVVDHGFVLWSVQIRH